MRVPTCSLSPSCPLTVIVYHNMVAECVQLDLVRTFFFSRNNPIALNVAGKLMVAVLETPRRHRELELRRHFLHQCCSLRLMHVEHTFLESQIDKK